VQSAATNGAWGSFELGLGMGGATTGLSEAYMRGSRRGASDQGVAYLSEEYFHFYRVAIEEGQRIGFPDSMIYDELGYPAGLAGGLFYSKYPELAGKSIEFRETNVVGPAGVQLTFPKPLFLGAVMMNRDTFERVDVSDRKTDPNTLACQVPAGNWKVMAFYLDDTFRPASVKGGGVDYLDRDAVAKYIAINFDPYYAHLKEFFGTVIKRTFYDEPAMSYVDGRLWTPNFNREFEKKYGYSPMTNYPALWYDIGPDTAAARNALFGFRAELFASNYVGQVAEWCEKHGVKMAGHQDQEEIRNPVAVSGDLMKVFEYQQVPGIDNIYYPGESVISYKVVTSAAFNYDRPECIAETYAAYRAMTPTIAMRTAMDQCALGVNMQMDARPREMDRNIGTFIGRLGYMLRGGRHVADVAVLYPIASLQADYNFNAKRNPGSQSGGTVPGANNYMDIGLMLSHSLRVDYTFLHPEVLLARCGFERGRLVLNNKENREEFRVLILPAGDTLSADTAKKLLEFYRGGGAIIGTLKLPAQSAEFGRDKEVQAMTAEVFGTSFEDSKSYSLKSNSAGGRGYFVPQPDITILNTILKEVDPVRDVDIQEPPLWPVKLDSNYDGALTYIHKVRAGRDIYFFSNSSDNAVDTKVVLRGDKNLTIWNPHTGGVEKAETAKSQSGGQPVTTVHLVLPAVTATFFVQEKVD
ncbi:MAG: glycosyl hydrolase, partial [Verrucomicrobiota bacterium]